MERERKKKEKGKVSTWKSNKFVLEGQCALLAQFLLHFQQICNALPTSHPQGLRICRMRQDAEKQKFRGYRKTRCEILLFYVTWLWIVISWKVPSPRNSKAPAPTPPRGTADRIPCWGGSAFRKRWDDTKQIWMAPFLEVDSENRS